MEQEKDDEQLETNIEQEKDDEQLETTNPGHRDRPVPETQRMPLPGVPRTRETTRDRPHLWQRK